MTDVPEMSHTELRDARVLLGMTQQELSSFLCYDVSMCSRWEAEPGKKWARPVPPLVARVVRWLRDVPGFVPPDWPTK